MNKDRSGTVTKRKPTEGNAAGRVRRSKQGDISPWCKPPAKPKSSNTNKCAVTKTKKMEARGTPLIQAKLSTSSGQSGILTDSQTESKHEAGTEIVVEEGGSPSSELSVVKFIHEIEEEKKRNRKSLHSVESKETETTESDVDKDSPQSDGKDDGGYKRVELSEIDKMTHKELQKFVRLHNNRIELYCTNEYFNWISHLAGAVIFIICTGILGAECEHYGCSALQIAAVISYAMCIAFMQTSSALHHGVGLGGVSWRVYNTLRMMDYMSIYIAIWGSFLPVLSIAIDFPINLVMFVLTTAIAVVGIVLKAIYNEQLKPIVGIGLYVVMGWNALAFSYFILKNAGVVCFILLILMGVSYTVGIIFFATERPIIIKKVIQGHELFHVFVLIGNLVHLGNIAFCIIPQTERLQGKVGA